MDNSGACGVALDVINIYRNFAAVYKAHVNVDLIPACELMQKANQLAAGQEIKDRTTQSCTGEEFDRFDDPREVLKKLVGSLVWQLYMYEMNSPLLPDTA
ncbi:unnamed protein product [Nippostrongylus brasiliensis]|uniref:Malic_M domain-containing protein n=1 Tax=Nippostrongylus brasiliensis TaxID=27835 RepID=A0A0N4XYF7_NIPBR|nr:unnamed protein product [Nippostrongylus brasiliensis]